MGAKEVAQQGRAGTAFAVDLSSIPSIHLGGLQPSVTPVGVPQLWPPWAPKLTQIYLHTDTQLSIHNKNT